MVHFHFAFHPAYLFVVIASVLEFIRLSMISLISYQTVSLMHFSSSSFSLRDVYSILIISIVDRVCQCVIMIMLKHLQSPVPNNIE